MPAEVAPETIEYRDDLWWVRATFTDANGIRSGGHAIQLPPSATEQDLKQAIIAAYTG